MLFKYFPDIFLLFKLVQIQLLLFATDSILTHLCLLSVIVYCSEQTIWFWFNIEESFSIELWHIGRMGMPTSGSWIKPVLIWILGCRGDASSDWVPATHLRDLGWVLKSWLWPPWSLQAFWGWISEWKPSFSLFLPLSLCPSLFPVLLSISQMNNLF